MNEVDLNYLEQQNNLGVKVRYESRRLESEDAGLSEEDYRHCMTRKKAWDSTGGSGDATLSLIKELQTQRMCKTALQVNKVIKTESLIDVDTPNIKFGCNVEV